MQTVAQIHQLSEGFVLETAAGQSVACTNLASLVRAIRSALPLDPDRGKLIDLAARRPTPAQVRAALAPQPEADRPAPVAQAQAATPTPSPAADALPPEQRAALLQIADAVYTGKLPDLASVKHNLDKYVPDLDQNGWNLFISEYVADRRANES